MKRTVILATIAALACGQAWGETIDLGCKTQEWQTQYAITISIDTDKGTATVDGKAFAKAIVTDTEIKLDYRGNGSHFHTVDRVANTYSNGLPGSSKAKCEKVD